MVANIVRDKHTQMDHMNCCSTLDVCSIHYEMFNLFSNYELNIVIGLHVCVKAKQQKENGDLNPLMWHASTRNISTLDCFKGICQKSSITFLINYIHIKSTNLILPFSKCTQTYHLSYLYIRTAMTTLFLGFNKLLDISFSTYCACLE